MTAWEWAKWPVLVLVVVAIVAGLYYAAPNVRLPGPSSVLPGAVLALGVWLVASAGFAFYAANFGSYNETYGALGGVVVFLVWLWLTNLAVVLGAEFNAERERGRQLAAGVPGAERRIQLAERSAAARKKARADRLRPCPAGGPTRLSEVVVGYHRPPKRSQCLRRTR
ncbi:YihY/virulence factor BrkB family protein [Streptomyces sp. GKU 257-1]|nr:YihY/virulence factor BrkB family protein [Streptomyces sp. GKU 257-1]